MGICWFCGCFLCRPFPRSESKEEQGGSSNKSHRRDDINQPVGSGTRRFGKHASSVIINKILFDLCFRFSLCKHLANEFTPLVTGGGRTYIQGGVLTNRAI